MLLLLKTTQDKTEDTGSGHCRASGSGDDLDTSERQELLENDEEDSPDLLKVRGRTLNCFCVCAFFVYTGSRGALHTNHDAILTPH